VTPGEACEHVEVSLSGIRALFGGERDRNPDTRVSPHHIRRRRHHADHHVFDGVEPDAATDDRGVAVEARLPESLVEDDHVVATRLIFVLRERPTEPHPEAQRREEVG